MFFSFQEISQVRGFCSVQIPHDIWQYWSDSMTGSISMRHSDRVANDIHEGGIVQSGPYRFSTLLSIIIIIFQHQISHLWWFYRGWNRIGHTFCCPPPHTRAQFLSMWHIANNFCNVLWPLSFQHTDVAFQHQINSFLWGSCNGFAHTCAPQKNHFYPTT